MVDPTPPEGAPYWVWLLGLAIIVGVPAITGVVVALVQRPVKKAVKAVEEQNVNEHANTPYPNMRDELTATRKAAEKAVAVAGRVEAGQRRHDAEIGGIRADIRQVRNEHGETRAWIAAEAVERRKIAEGLQEHLGFAEKRDIQIAALTEAVHRSKPEEG